METGTMSFPRFKVPLVIYVSRDLPILVRTNLCQHAVILPWLSGGGGGAHKFVHPASRCVNVVWIMLAIGIQVS